MGSGSDNMLFENVSEPLLIADGGSNLYNSHYWPRLIEPYTAVETRLKPPHHRLCITANYKKTPAPTMGDGVFERLNPIFPYGSDYRFHLSILPYWKVNPVSGTNSVYKSEINEFACEV